MGRHAFVKKRMSQRTITNTLGRETAGQSWGYRGLRFGRVALQKGEPTRAWECLTNRAVAHAFSITWAGGYI